ncbi:unnamed protein product [Anisakis simplex]|uniref:Fibrinogen C-terminal domain-containing protein n=1 Tax=Anisakis simplex TaxID=6269 RepID=A0A0M3JVF7_ANISI|nr:unnamed protein product [Anisakis simplex]
MIINSINNNSSLCASAIINPSSRLLSPLSALSVTSLSLLVLSVTSSSPHAVTAAAPEIFHDHAKLLAEYPNHLNARCANAFDCDPQGSSLKCVPLSTIRDCIADCPNAADEIPPNPADCADLQLHYKNRIHSGRYVVYNWHCANASRPDCAFQVNCDMQIFGGGWTVILQRMNLTKSFDGRTIDDYEKGFELDTRNFWIGVDELQDARMTAFEVARKECPHSSGGWWRRRCGQHGVLTGSNQVDQGGEYDDGLRWGGERLLALQMLIRPRGYIVPRAN